MQSSSRRAIIGGLLISLIAMNTHLDASLLPGQQDQQGLNRFVGWDDYLTAWETADWLRSHRMYPFKEEFGDNPSIYDGVSLPISFQFYAVKYKSLYISRDAHFRFSTLPEAPPSKYMRQLLPNQLYPDPRQDDPAIAAIFYAPHDFGGKGSIHYREMRRSTGSSARDRIDNGQLEQLSAHVQAAVVGADHFRAEHGVIATWEHMTFEGVRLKGPDQYPMNTYQMVLVTDGTETFVIFNFFDVTWAGSVGGSMDCDPTTGLKSDNSPHCRGPQIGFNVGEGRHFWESPYSKSLRVVDLDLLENRGSSVQGRHFYKVSDAFILRGGCTVDPELFGNPAWPLAISPTSGGMLGGYDVNVSAPCFTSGDRITCRFGDGHVTDGVVSGGNVMKARCPAPRLASVGQLTVSLSVDGGIGFPFTTRITIGMMGYVAAGVQLENPGDDWLNVNRFQITWDPRAVTWQDVDFVDIRLYGYRESPNQAAATWRLLRVIAASIKNDGYYDLVTGSHQCGDGQDAKTDCTQFSMGLLMVAIATSDEGASPTALWSDPLPIGWFVRTAAHKYLGPKWAHEMCRFWHADDIKHDQWSDGLPVCPCLLSQAFADWGRFPVDINCNVMNAGTANNCRRHKRAKHCVISSYTTSRGAGSHCCYDASGRLMYSGDTEHGSTPDRAHSWGTPPYGRSPRVPGLSHWYWDVAPFYTCCAWQSDEYDCFNLFIARRTTPSCKPYSPPGLAAAFGDPHFRTYDGVTYTFNGKGEFWLLLVDNAMIGEQQLSFALQARMEQPKPLSWGTPQATAITAVVMQETLVGSAGGATVEIQRNNYAPGDRLLLVYVNGELLDFREPAMGRQDFPEFVITTNDPVTARVHGNFTVIFRASGIGIQVAHKYGLIHVITVIPPQLKGLTEGLLGIWDDNPDNDLMPRGGGQTVPSEDTKRIHDTIAYSWQIGQSESRFRYWAKLNRDYYLDETFKPKFKPQFPVSGSQGVTSKEVDAVCGADKPCRYDYMITLRQQVALDTLQVQEWVREQVQNAKPELTCGWLNIPNAIKRPPLLHGPGSVIVVTGCRNGFKLEGATRYTCSSDGSATWQPALDTRCIDLGDVRKAQSRLAVAIGVPVGIVLLLIVIGIAALLCYLRQKQIDRKLKENPADELIHVPVSQFHASDLRQEEDPQPNRDGRWPRPPRPQRHRPDAASMPAAALPLSRSQDDVSLYGSKRLGRRLPAMSASADNLDDLRSTTMTSSGKDSIDLNSTLESGSTAQRPGRAGRPYDYPRNTDTLHERRRAPYLGGYQAGRGVGGHPPDNDVFTPEERALIETRAREYNV